MTWIALKLKYTENIIGSNRDDLFSIGGSFSSLYLLDLTSLSLFHMHVRDYSKR